MQPLTVTRVDLDDLAPLTLNTAAAFLGTRHYQLAKLIEADYLPDLTRRNLLPVLEAPFAASQTGSLPVAQIAPVRRAPADDGRRWIGDHRRLTDQDWVDAVRGDWNGSIGVVLDAGLLAIGLGGFITGVLRITDFHPAPAEGGKAKTNLVRFDAELLARLTGRIGTPAHLGEPSGGFTEQERTLAEMLPGTRYQPVSGPSIGFI